MLLYPNSKAWLRTVSIMLRFSGSEQFRQRLVYSTLAGRAIRIDDIRSRDENPGLRDFEASFLRLLEKVTNGCIVEINETGTSLRYKPGFVHNGAGLTHDCGTSRGIGYYLEPLVILALFGKKPLSITLHGITNDDIDPGVDVWRTVTLPLLRKLTGSENQFELKVLKRGTRPRGGGEIFLQIPIINKLPPISMLDEGMVKRIRGVAYSMRVSPQISNRVVDGARGLMNQLLADVYIFTDHMSGLEAGGSPGYGLALVAETTAGRMLSAECSTHALGEAEVMEAIPEDLGRRTAAALLEEIHRGGVVDGGHQGLVLTLCALGPEEINEIRLGPLTPYAVRTLRNLKEFFSVQFQIKPEASSQTIFLSCIGAGLKNISKKIN